MVNFPGRNGRRRRVLNEEVLSATGSRSTFRAVSEDDSSHQSQRYSEAAGVENHPQVTDFVPRRYRTIALLIGFGALSTAALVGLHFAVPSIAAAVGLTGLPPFDLTSAGSLAAWVSAVILLVASGLCLLIYSIRQHRIDDYRGRYRIWFVASAVCLALSANSITGLHHVLAYTFSEITGWTALRAGAAWWLALIGVPLGWIALRTLRDMVECRLATALWIAAISCYVAAATSYLGLTPAIGRQTDAIVDTVLALVGHWLLLATAIAYARFVILDAQGLITIRARSKPVLKVKRGTETERESVPAARNANLAVTAVPQIHRIDSAASRKDWIDGSRPEDDHYDDSDDDSLVGQRKLSKADRKRLRKLKAQSQNRAA